jgi:hypothetical protein
MTAAHIAGICRLRSGEIVVLPDKITADQGIVVGSDPQCSCGILTLPDGGKISFAGRQVVITPVVPVQKRCIRLSCFLSDEALHTGASGLGLGFGGKAKVDKLTADPYPESGGGYKSFLLKPTVNSLEIFC